MFVNAQEPGGRTRDPLVQGKWRQVRDENKKSNGEKIEDFF